MRNAEVPREGLGTRLGFVCNNSYSAIERPWLALGGPFLCFMA